MGVQFTPWSLAVFCVVSCACAAPAQQTSDSVRQVPHSSSMTFMERDGTCIDGPISKVDATTITVAPYGKPQVTIQRADLLQITQGDALVFTAINSWATVEQAAAHVYPHEIFVLKLNVGKVVKGKPVEVTPESLSLKHGLLTTEFKKNQLATIDYLRVKPESDKFDYFSQEAPALLFFDPEFYYRAMGLEGRIPVRLYDGAKPQTAVPPSCSRQ